MGATVIAAAPLSLLSRVANLECDSTMMIMRRQWWICTCANSVPMAQECCCSSICFSSLVNFVPSCSFWPLLLRHSFHSSSPSIAAARTKQMRGIICQDHLLRPLRPRQEMMRQKMGTGRKFFRFSLRRPQFAKRKKSFFAFLDGSLALRQGQKGNNHSGKKRKEKKKSFYIFEERRRSHKGQSLLKVGRGLLVLRSVDLLTFQRKGIVLQSLHACCIAKGRFLAAPRQRKWGEGSAFVD